MTEGRSLLVEKAQPAVVCPEPQRPLAIFEDRSHRIAAWAAALLTGVITDKAIVALVVAVQTGGGAHPQRTQPVLIDRPDDITAQAVRRARVVLVTNELISLPVVAIEVLRRWCQPRASPHGLRKWQERSYATDCWDTQAWA